MTTETQEETMEAATALLEPAKKETRSGWWFMRRFRRREVGIRTARNEVIGAAWTVLVGYDDWVTAQTPEIGEQFRKSRDRLALAFDSYIKAQDA